ncbi:MAG: HEPN domain-containing protein [Chloroflexota bacterium]|nr:MAG: HEPN domain-containing protein [Chloroflexota bacterium]
MRHARSDLAIAGQPRTPDVLLETLCFHAQQAAEKSLKAVLVGEGVPFPFTHDLAILVTLVKQAGISWPESSYGRDIYTSVLVLAYVAKMWHNRVDTGTRTYLWHNPEDIVSRSVRRDAW